LVAEIQWRQQEQQKLEELKQQKVSKVKYKNQQLNQFLMNYEIKQMEELERKQQKVNDA
jgi:hypothetical protein